MKSLLKFDLDPTPRKALIICVCLFIVTFVTGIQAIAVSGQMPTDTQLLTILCGSIGVSITYVLSFLGYEHKEKKEDG